MTSRIFNGGLGLRPSYYPFLESHSPRLARWFEIISENYMDSQGQPLTKLLKLRQDFPIACHGVSLGLGGPDPVSQDYLKRLKNLIQQVDPFIVSDHFCWSGMGGHAAHDLLPLPYTQECLQRIVQKIDQVQTFLGRPLLLENPSAYLMFRENTFSEAEFLTEVCRQSGCQLLLDVNNVFVSCTNFAWDPLRYLQSLPTAMIGQIHLAGFTDKKKFLFDTHSHPVDDRVWSLYADLAARLPATTPVMVEWDDNLPSFEVYEQELIKARSIWMKSHEQQNLSAIL